MAEGWARALAPDIIEPFSAGTHPSTLNALAVRVMAEAGVDIASQRSKHVDELGPSAFDLVVTVCGAAQEACPTFSRGTSVVHVGFDDPPHLARDARNDDEALPHYRRVRDEIRRFIETMPEQFTLNRQTFTKEIA